MVSAMVAKSLKEALHDLNLEGQLKEIKYQETTNGLSSWRLKFTGYITIKSTENFTLVFKVMKFFFLETETRTFSQVMGLIR